MPVKKSAKSASDECCAKCEKDIAALRKEVAALKRELAKKPAGGSDPRVDAIINIIGNNQGFIDFCTQAVKIK